MFSTTQLKQILCAIAKYLKKQKLESSRMTSKLICAQQGSLQTCGNSSDKCLVCEEYWICSNVFRSNTNKGPQLSVENMSGRFSSVA